MHFSTLQTCHVLIFFNQFLDIFVLFEFGRIFRHLNKETSSLLQSLYKVQMIVVCKKLFFWKKLSQYRRLRIKVYVNCDLMIKMPTVKNGTMFDIEQSNLKCRCQSIPKQPLFNLEHAFQPKNVCVTRRKTKISSLHNYSYKLTATRLISYNWLWIDLCVCICGVFHMSWFIASWYLWGYISSKSKRVTKMSKMSAC